MILLIAVVAFTLFVTLRSSDSIVSDEDIRQATLAGFDKYEFDSNNSALEIKDTKYLKERWVIATIILTGEPDESEAREMVYIYSKNEKAIELVAFSGDGFSRNSFPETMPYDDVTEIIQGIEEGNS